MWGLARGLTGVTIEQKVFSCCGGDGIAVSEVDPRNARLCGLSRRWNLLSLVLRAKSDLSFKKEDISGLEDFFKRHLDAILRADRGQIINAAHTPSIPAGLGANLPWTLAATIGWHFEVLTLITKLGDGTVPFNHWNELLGKFHGSRVIVMIDGVTELWTPARLEALEAIIGFASERLLPVWLFETQGSAKSSQADPQKARSFKSAVNKRLTEIRGKSTVDWLSEQCHGRLREICAVPARSTRASGIPEFV
jgi:hypothetical protein